MSVAGSEEDGGRKAKEPLEPRVVMMPGGEGEEEDEEVGWKER